MMSRLMATLVVVVMITGLMVAPAFAQEEVAPGGGNAFGKHVSGMAPEHPNTGGVEFGVCVSTMARTGSCPHVS
jgi:hypothetical protein